MGNSIGKIKYRPNGKGMVKVMQTQEMQDLCFTHANKILDNIGDKHGTFEVGPDNFGKGGRERVTGATRAHAFVRTGDAHARNAEAMYGLLNRAAH